VDIMVALAVEPPGEPAEAPETADPAPAGVNGPAETCDHRDEYGSVIFNGICALCLASIPAPEMTPDPADEAPASPADEADVVAQVSVEDPAAVPGDDPQATETGELPADGPEDAPAPESGPEAADGGQDIPLDPGEVILATAIRWEPDGGLPEAVPVTFVVTSAGRKIGIDPDGWMAVTTGPPLDVVAGMVPKPPRRSWKDPRTA
jgi:hypothetical protein